MPLDFTRMRELLEQFREVVRKTGKPAVVATQGRREPEPRNNDGRRHCWWCWSWTERKEGFTGMYDICPKCGK